MEIRILCIILVTMLIVISTNGEFFLYAISTPERNHQRLPVLLLHGYLSDSSMWKRWEQLLGKDDISYQNVTFKQDDKCGTASEHAKELAEIVQNFKKSQMVPQINIVAYSKGGLEARAYLANNLSNNDVANLIMIGTPNAGSPLANTNTICSPAIYDLMPGAPVTEVPQNKNTKYYTVAGDWNPLLLFNCLEPLEYLPTEIAGYFALRGKAHNDGLVTVPSVESQGYFKSLGHTDDCHSNLLSEKGYGLIRRILIG